MKHSAIANRLPSAAVHVEESRAAGPAQTGLGEGAAAELSGKHGRGKRSEGWLSSDKRDLWMCRRSIASCSMLTEGPEASRILRDRNLHSRVPTIGMR